MLLRGWHRGQSFGGADPGRHLRQQSRRGRYPRAGQPGRSLGLHVLTVGTSANSANSVNFQVLNSGSISDLSLSRSDGSPGASNVTYTIGFITSATGGVAENTGTISLEAAPGTFPAPPGCGDPIVVTDLTTKASDQTGSLCSSEVGDQGERLLISSPVSIGGDNRIEVVVPGLDNPSGAGPHTLVAGTSSDRTRSIGLHDVCSQVTPLLTSRWR